MRWIQDKNAVSGVVVFEEHTTREYRMPLASSEYFDYIIRLVEHKQAQAKQLAYFDALNNARKFTNERTGIKSGVLT